MRPFAKLLAHVLDEAVAVQVVGHLAFDAVIASDLEVVGRVQGYLRAPWSCADLVLYGTPSNVHRVGLYIGAGKMVNAPTYGQPVTVAPYRWTGDDYLAASRPVDGTTV